MEHPWLKSIANVHITIIVYFTDFADFSYTLQNKFKRIYRNINKANSFQELSSLWLALLKLLLNYKEGTI